MGAEQGAAIPTLTLTSRVFNPQILLPSISKNLTPSTLTSKNMNIGVIYARVSSRDQEIEGFSIPAQIKVLQEYASKNQITVIQIFTDVETAKRAGRTQFSKMVGYISENSIAHILVEKTDRLLRNITDYATIDGLIEQSGVKVHLVKENVVLSRDSRSNEKFIFGIKALMAKNYVDNLSEEVRKGMTE